MAALVDGARILMFGAGDFVDPAIRTKLEALGATILGPVTSPTSALMMLRLLHIDESILDSSVIPLKFAPVIMSLSNRKVPFVFAHNGEDKVRAKYRLVQEDTALAELLMVLFDPSRLG